MIEIGSVQWCWMKWWEANKEKVIAAFADGTSISDILRDAYYAGHREGLSQGAAPPGPNMGW